MLEIENLSKSFGPFDAVKKINFSIKRGEVVGLLGPNGAGKTTTMRMMTGFYAPTEGDVKFEDKSIKDHRFEIQRKIGYLPESASSYTDMTVCDFLHFVGNARNLGDKLEKGIEKAIVSTTLQKFYFRPISQLSKGYKQRVGLAAALIHDPEILILDEPTAGLDPNQIIEIQNLITSLSNDKTIILSTHILKEVEATCQRALIINDGELVLDKPLIELQSAREGKFKVVATFKGRVNDAIDKLKVAFEGSGQLEQVSSSDHGTTISVLSGDDTAEKIFHTAISNNWVLTELSPEKQSLEDVFKQITA